MVVCFVDGGTHSLSLLIHSKDQGLSFHLPSLVCDALRLEPVDRMVEGSFHSSAYTHHFQSAIGYPRCSVDVTCFGNQGLFKLECGDEGGLAIALQHLVESLPEDCWIAPHSADEEALVRLKRAIDSCKHESTK